MSMATVSASTGISPSLRPSAAKMCTLLSAVRIKTFLLSSEWTRSSGLAGSDQLACTVQLRAPDTLVFLTSWAWAARGRSRATARMVFLSMVRGCPWGGGRRCGPELLVRRPTPAAAGVGGCRPWVYVLEFQRLLPQIGEAQKTSVLYWRPAECARSNNSFRPRRTPAPHRPQQPGFPAPSACV